MVICFALSINAQASVVFGTSLAGEILWCNGRDCFLFSESRKEPRKITESSVFSDCKSSELYFICQDEERNYWTALPSFKRLNKHPEMNGAEAAEIYGDRVFFLKRQKRKWNIWQVPIFDNNITKAIPTQGEILDFTVADSTVYWLTHPKFQRQNQPVPFEVWKWNQKTNSKHLVVRLMSVSRFVNSLASEVVVESWNEVIRVSGKNVDTLARGLDSLQIFSWDGKRIYCLSPKEELISIENEVTQHIQSCNPKQILLLAPAPNGTVRSICIDEESASIKNFGQGWPKWWWKQSIAEKQSWNDPYSNNDLYHGAMETMDNIHAK